MKLWVITTTIETDDHYDPQKIMDQIDCDLNRGNGIYVSTSRAKRKITPKPKRWKWIGTQKFPVF